jgi:hypothetical protein
LEKATPAAFEGTGGGGLFAKLGPAAAAGATAAWAVGGLFAIGALAGGVFDIGALPGGGVFDIDAFVSVEGVAALACRFIRGAFASSEAFRFIAQGGVTSAIDE